MRNKIKITHSLQYPWQLTLLAQSDEISGSFHWIDRSAFRSDLYVVDDDLIEETIYDILHGRTRILEFLEVTGH